MERQIRKNKERLHVAKQLGDKELINKFKLKGRLLDDTLKGWIKDHEFLHRDRERERLRMSEAELQQKVEKALEKRYNEFNKHLTQKISKDEYMDFVSHDLDKIRRVVESNSELSARIALKEVKQEQHILGSTEYTKRDNGQSYFVNTTAEAIHTHMLTNMDMNELFRRYQFVDIGQNKGVFVSDIDGSKDADQIKVHQGKKGIHGVPNQNKHSAERGGINDG